ncbi:restriction endonuclease subunit S [Paraclostridium sordellii]|uniref:restriction endonuclease subunit S n=1 Tax=Paraclostridium sordellii TaxID=1505 RepID=UPI0005E34203|nr:restriction endonuclease subunit S [Paeniclostridium sordellii]CEP80039.1 type I restriction-modification system subunit S [[Clostridium] sordellii] [Paeniclostridium sordellii]
MSEKLGKFITLISGRDLSKSEYNDKENGIPYIMGASNMQKGKLFVERWTETPTVIGKKNDLIISVKGTIGELLILDEKEVHLSRQVMAIRTDETINNKFIFYYLTKYMNKLKEKAKGMIPGITRADILDIDYKSVDLRTQESIVNILDKAQELIDKRKDQIESLDELVESRFIEMFGNPLNNPEGWEETTLDYYSNLVTYGLTVRPDYIDTGIPLISAKEIRSGVVGYNDAPKISIEDYNKLSEKGKPKKNDILFSKTGSIGHCALVDDEDIFAITQNAARISLNLDIINPLWCLYYLRTDYIREWCQRKSKGNAVKDFQLKDMKKIPIFVCDKKLQDQFADFVKQVDKLKFKMENSLKELENNFNSLMQKAFNGEL